MKENAEVINISIRYIGKSKNTIKLLYREFYSSDTSSDNLSIRPPFTHEITYDLDESNLINLRNIKIQIIEATNQKIKYKVISD